METEKTRHMVHDLTWRLLSSCTCTSLYLMFLLVECGEDCRTDCSPGWAGCILKFRYLSTKLVLPNDHCRTLLLMQEIMEATMSYCMPCMVGWQP